MTNVLAQGTGRDPEFDRHEARAEYILGNPELPVAGHREAIETAIRDNSVTILVAPTGSGKTTQIPQFAVEMKEYGRPQFDQIIVTQPRIVAARSVSARVRDEIFQTGGGYKVGYYTSKESTDAPQREQDIAFLTDGKAAAQILHAMKRPNPTTKRLLVIDEVHEWNLEIEQLIAVATDKTNPRSEHYDPNLKVVIMSATMDSERLKQHFRHVQPPVITVEVPTHRVRREITSESVARVALRTAADSREKVLAFLPGKREIKNIARQIAEDQKNTACKVAVVPLHGQQDAEKQQRAFRDYRHGAVVATTNAAETSLTVPGAVAVIDSGEVRVDRISYEHIESGSDGLYLEEAARANLLQRLGRVGRTGPGVYVLASPDGRTRPTPLEDREAYATPAMERTRLDNLVLRFKATGNEVGDFNFFHTPPKAAVQAAEARLRVLGALDRHGNVTERGQVMNSLPLSAEYACMLAFAVERGYSDDVKRHLIDIVSIMEVGGILKRAPKEQRWRDLLQQDVFGDVQESDSDFFAQLAVYTELIDNVDPDEWGDHDVIEYAVSVVELGRASLAERLGVALQDARPITAENRQAVLTCINAGQLNQLWLRSDAGWSLAFGSGEVYSQSESSVVRGLGEFATGTLFSLGLSHKTIDAVQNMNVVLSQDSLELAARHLVVDTVDRSSVTFDAERHLAVATVTRKLGNFTLRTFERPIDVEVGSPESRIISRDYRARAWDELEAQQRHDRVAFTSPHDLEHAMENIETKVYGTDPVTGEDLIAYRGGNGRWCFTKEIALNSFASQLDRMQKAPKKAKLRDLKNAIKERQAELHSLKQSGKVTPEEVKKLLSARKKIPKEDWLHEADHLIERAQSQ